MLISNLQGIWSLSDNRNLVTSFNSNRWDSFQNLNLVEKNDSNVRKLASDTRNDDKSKKDIYKTGRLII